MPQVIFWAIGAVGAAIMAKWLANEARRVNTDLDRVKEATADTPRDRPVLRRDPKTGVYRPK